MNVDGSSLGNPGHSGGGGIIRDHHGQVRSAFSSFYGFRTNMESKAGALLEDLQLCLSLGLTKVIVHMDLVQLLNLLKQVIAMPWKVDVQIRRIRHVLTQAEFVLEHYYRRPIQQLTRSRSKQVQDSKLKQKKTLRSM
nr:uncharacterized protein LOC113724260 [Coffea arabica]